MCLIHVGSPLDDADDVIPLGEIGQPVVQRLLLLLVEVLPVGSYVFGLG